MLSNRVDDMRRLKVGSEEKSDMIRFQFALMTVVLAIVAGIAGASVSEPPEGAGGNEGRHARAITLKGTWEFAFGEGTERA